MRWEYIIKRAVWLLALGVLCYSCQREPDLSSVTKEGIPSLSIAIDFPRSEGVKSDAYLRADTPENEIKSLRIWVFRHDDSHELVVAKILNKDVDGFPEDGGVRWYNLDVSWKFVLEKPSVDVFVLANAESIGCDLDDHSDWATIRTATFGYESNTKDPFGLSEYTEEVPEEGLPMSAMKLGLELRGTGTQLKVDALQLRRAVSRIRMVFCKTQTELPEGQEPDELSVDQIIIYPNQLPLKEYIFTENITGVYKDANLADDEQNYDERTYSRGGVSSENIKAHPAPENLVYANQNPSTYKDLLDDAKNHGLVSDLGYVYFRESDVRLVGRINYTVNGKSRFREFSMKSDGDFARNHTWTLFAYFLSGRNLQLSLVVDDWDRSDYFVDFSDQIVVAPARFVIDPSTAEVTDVEDGYTNVRLIPGVPVKGRLRIVAPLGGTLMIYPQGAATLFNVSPMQATIKADEDEDSEESDSGLIEIEISYNNDIDINVDDLSEDEKTMTFSFFVETPAGRIINVNSEVVDRKYRFIL